MLGEQVRVEEGQLDRVADGLDLRAQPADVGVVDVRDLLQHEVLDLGLGHPLVGEAGPGVDGQGVPDAHRLAEQRGGEPDDPLLVGVRRDERPVRRHELLDGDELADPLEAGDGDDVHRLVEHDLAARLELPDRHSGRDRDAELAPAGGDVRGAVLADAHERPERRGRLGETLDLAAQGDDLLAGVAEGLGEALVLHGDPAGLGPGTRHLVLQAVDPQPFTGLVHVGPPVRRGARPR